MRSASTSSIRPTGRSRGASYTELFGWRFEAVEGGPGPDFAIHRGEATNGGMMQLPPGQAAPSHWLVYFGIDDLEVAGERIDSSGGRLVVPALDVPGGQILVAQDPHAATFALFAGRLDD